MLEKTNVLFSIADHPTPKIDKSNVGFTLESRDYKMPQAVAIELHPQDSRYKTDNETFNQPLASNMEHDPANGGLVMVLEHNHTDSRVKVNKDNIIQTLSCRMGTGGGNVPMVVEGINGDVAGTLDSSYYKGCGERQGVERDVVVDQEYDNLIVRRLTPMECSRLQGYPDDWMDIGEWTDSKGKVHKDADAPKYKAAGNSIALPFWQWLMDKIGKQLRKDGNENPTMASLFDGISGFPLCAARVGIEPVWSSEIEEFPIAVAEKHFGENGDYKKYL